MVLGGLVAAYGASPSRAVDGGLLGAAFALVLAHVDTRVEAVLVGAGCLTCVLKAALSRPAGSQRMAVVFGCIAVGVAIVLLVVAVLAVVSPANVKETPRTPVFDLEAGANPGVQPSAPAIVLPIVSKGHVTENRSRSRSRDRSRDRGRGRGRDQGATTVVPYTPLF